MEEYRSCHLCPRACGVDRTRGALGVCRSAAVPLVAHTMLHEWEEPCLVGARGSGAVFFSGCGLGCVFCQNRRISSGQVGKPYTIEMLAETYLRLESDGAANINLVTAAHFLPHVRDSLLLARKKGLRVPIVYNSSGYESLSSLRSLDGLIDIYLPDFRYLRRNTALRYSHAADYPQIVEAAVAEMVRQTGAPQFLEDGRMEKGTMIILMRALLFILLVMFATKWVIQKV